MTTKTTTNLRPARDGSARVRYTTHYGDGCSKTTVVKKGGMFGFDRIESTSSHRSKRHR